MNTTENLHRLIKSLTSPEKTYLKRQLKFHQIKGQSNYLKLYELVAKQEVFDEKKLAMPLKRQKFSNHLSATVHHLTKRILAAMRNYHAESGVDSQLHNLIQDVLFLHKKGHYSQAVKMYEQGC